MQLTEEYLFDFDRIDKPIMTQWKEQCSSTYSSNEALRREEKEGISNAIVTCD